MKIKIKKVSKFFLYMLFILLFPISVSAETHVKNSSFRNGGIMRKANSPYILDENLYISDGYTITIEPGVTVISASTTPAMDGPNTFIIDKGTLNIMGTAEDKVYLKDLEGLYLTDTTLNIENAVLDGTRLIIWRGKTKIKNTEIENNKEAVVAVGAEINIENSKIRNNKYGIYSDKFIKVYLISKNNSDSEGMGGIGNALVQNTGVTLDPLQNNINVHNSSFSNNTLYDIYNKTLNPVFAENNWWASSTGPNMTKIYGIVNIKPWLERDIENTCCSNVLFLPGIQASRLYRDNKQYLGTSTERLWEPFGNTKLQALALDANGKSIDNSIYTKDLVDSAFGFYDIYKSFIAMMNGVVAEGIINEWLPFPYDWRSSVYDVVYGQTRKATSSVSLIDEVESLAKRSRTGKIVIIAHSNGGLVAKMLMRALEERGEGAMIEKIVDIAVPELGTPKAILSMLHGYGQSIAKGLLASENNARILSSNMLGAYGLLPSEDFFKTGPFKVISDIYSSTTEITYDTYKSMNNFLTSNVFSTTTSNNVNIPLLLSKYMIEQSQGLHSIIDNWKPASTTKVVSLRGWGLPTVRGIEYIKDMHCRNKAGCKVSYLPELMDDGDGTVLNRSNANLADTSLFIDLNRLSKLKNESVQHADILESTEVQGVVKKEIENNTGNGYGDYITMNKPLDITRWLNIKIFSPVDIDVYDKDGNHTGISPNSSSTLGLTFSENNIPTSFYEDYGGMKLVRLPYDNVRDYQILLRGNDIGTVIVKADIEQGGSIIASTTFSEMPVTPMMNAELLIATTTEAFSTSTVINTDVDGDGVMDFTNHTNEYLKTVSGENISDYITYLESIKKIILVLKLKDSQEKQILHRIDKIMKELSDKDHRIAEKIDKIFPKKWFKKNKINDEQIKEILSSIMDMLDKLDHK